VLHSFLRPAQEGVALPAPIPPLLMRNIKKPVTLTDSNFCAEKTQLRQ
jgi:hypothetical protein